MPVKIKTSTGWVDLDGTDTHNALDGLQGGDSGAGEYFHLSQLELDRVNSRNIDGGHASDTYLFDQNIDGGDANG